MDLFTEKEIIEGCRRNERVFQEHLYKNYYNMFLKVCARYARDMEDAEQLMQDGFLKIFSHIGDFGFKGSFEGWMRRIIVNTCLDYLKSKYLKNSMQLRFGPEITENEVFSVRNDALDNLRLKEILDLIQQLPPMSRVVFNLFVFEGYAHKEIARMLDMSEGTSQWHVNNARKLLKAQLKNEKSKKLKPYEQKRI